MKMPPPLCVDLDGTLIQTDILIETFFQLIRQNVFNIFLVFVWIAQGKAILKNKIADRVDIDPQLLPYNKEFISFLKNEKATGRHLTLVTATHKKFAYEIANYLDLFDDVFATDSDINLSGKHKQELLCRRYGERGFDYAGNSSVDLKIWSHAREAILVSPEHGVESAAERCVDVTKIFPDKHNSIRNYILALRPHQWLKNLLLFIPLLAAHKWSGLDSLLNIVVAFISFSVCASSVYLLNDLMDLPEDRQHPRKRRRPFAAGTASVKTGTLLMAILLPASFVLAFAVSPYFLGILGIYYSVTLAYSSYLKRIVLVDVFTLAGLYTIRIIAGAIAVEVTPSFWLLAFSMFIFLSLAMVKRFSELQGLKKIQRGTVAGRGYMVDDLETLNSLGVSSGYLAVLVLALYINSPDILALYTNPKVIWFLCPLILFWISRIWLSSRRGEMHDDPIIFALKDPVSHLVGIVSFIIVFVAL